MTVMDSSPDLTHRKQQAHVMIDMLAPEKLSVVVSLLEDEPVVTLKKPGCANQTMQLVLNDVETQAPVILHPPPMTDDEFFDFCQLYPDFRIERTAEGEVIIMPPTAMETGFRNNELSRQLGNWAREDGRGKAFDSSTEFILPSGAARSPDAAWVANSRLAVLTREQTRKFTRISPDFIVELMSPSDRLNRLQEKMCEWIEGGVQLGWLIDPDKRVVYVYGAGQEPESVAQPERIEGQGPVAGFVLELESIWSGL